MSLDIWPPVGPEEAKVKMAEVQERELVWIAQRTARICLELKHGLEDCYALLAPIDPGSTLVMSTPRNEKVKGTITRVGSRIVKGTLGLQLRMVSPQTITVTPAHPIHIRALDTLHTHLTESIDLLEVTLSNHNDHSNKNDNKVGTPSSTSSSSSTFSKINAQSLSSALRLLSESIASSIALLKGPPLADLETTWISASSPPAHFSPPLPPNLSLHFTLQECCVVLWLRVLEPVDAPVHFGTKLGLAMGTFRRLEHDETDMVFSYNPKGDVDSDTKRVGARHLAAPRLGGSRLDQASTGPTADVYVREKVRIESADPSLISLHSKLGFLSHMLSQARRNLAAVMGTDIED